MSGEAPVGRRAGPLGMAAVGGTHLVWATAGAWPAGMRTRLALAVTGGDAMPGPVPCCAVGLALSGAAALILRGGRTGRTVGLLSASALAARAFVGGRTAARLIGVRHPDPVFLTLDEALYRPLCLLLAAAVRAAPVR